MHCLCAAVCCAVGFGLVGLGWGSRVGSSMPVLALFPRQVSICFLAKKK